MGRVLLTDDHDGKVEALLRRLAVDMLGKGGKADFALW